MNDSGETISNEAFQRLLKLLRYLRRHRHQMKGQGISPRDYSVLRFLHESGPATVGEVQAYLHSSPSTASTLIAQLDGAGAYIPGILDGLGLQEFTVAFHDGHLVDPGLFQFLQVRLDDFL